MSQVKFTDGTSRPIPHWIEQTTLETTKVAKFSQKTFSVEYLNVLFTKFFQILSGEKVLCYHGQLIYEAKLLKTQVKDRTVKYYIHYAGWSKNWDEWVGENRVLKYNEVNVQLQKEIQKKMESSTKNTKKAAKSGPKKA